MEQARHKRLYGLHEWTGLLFGLFIFMVSFTGTVAMFADELTFWEATELRSAASAQERSPAAAMTPEAILEPYLAAAPATTKFRNLFLSLPSRHAGYYALFGQRVERQAGDPASEAVTQIEQRWHAMTGEPLADRGPGLARWLLDIHRDLMLPNRTIGRFLVGVAGLLMLVSIISGIFTHQKILRELFTLRVGKSKRLQWKDAHNALGAWALPFHAMIAFSGAYLGLVVILLPIFAFTAFKGNQEAAIEAVIGKAPEAAGIAAEPYPISSAIAKAELTSGYAATGVRLLHYGDENARYEAFLKVDDQLQISDVVAFSGTTGAPVPATAPGLEKQTVAEVVLNALVALHYATYGGIWLKVLYIGLGLALCVMVGTGLMVWVERRANGPTGRLARSTYLLMGRFNTGCMMGLPVATALVFYADRLIQVAADARITMIGSVYLGTWCVVALMGTIVRNPRWWFRVTLGLSGALAMGILPLDALTLGEGSLFDSAQSLALAFDLGLALLGSLALVVALNLEGFAVKPLPARGSGPLQAVVQAQER